MSRSVCIHRGSRRVFLLLAAVALVRALCGHASAADSRPNVVLFLVDDMGWMDCGAYGSTYYETPNIDVSRSRRCVLPTPTRFPFVRPPGRRL